MAATNGDFWVIIGSAAPVIALANAVALNGTLRSAFQTAREARRTRPTPRGSSELVKSVQDAFFGPYAIAVLGFACDVVAVAFALVAVGFDLANPVMAWIGAIVTVLSLILVGVQAILAAVAEGQHGR